MSVTELKYPIMADWTSLMLDSLLQVRYNNKRKTLVDFSGFGHLFATQLSCDSCVAFLLPVSRKY